MTVEQLRDAWPEILEIVEREKLSAWMVVMTATVRAFADEVLTLSFPSTNDVELFKRPVGAGEGVSEYLRRAIQQLLGVRVKYIARVERPDEGGPAAPVAAAAVAPAAAGSASAPAGAAAPVATDSALAGSASSAPAPAGDVASASADRPSAPAADSGTPTSASPAPAPSASSAPAAAPVAAGAAAPAATPSSAATSAPTTSWDVAPIPQSAPPEPDEPEYITEEPPDGVPEYDAEPPAATAVPVTPDAGTPSGGAQSSTTWSTAAIGADETPATASATPTPGVTDASTPPAAGGGPATAADPARGVTAAAGRDPSAPARGIAQGSRYGEAVVREILGAQFIHEETIAPKVSPQAPPVEGA